MWKYSIFWGEFVALLSFCLLKFPPDNTNTMKLIMLSRGVMVVPYFYDEAEFCLICTSCHGNMFFCCFSQISIMQA